MSELQEEIIIEFIGKELYKLEGVNQKALANLSIETDLRVDLWVNEIQIKQILFLFKKQFKVNCCEKQLSSFNNKVAFFLNALRTSSPFIRSEIAA